MIVSCLIVRIGVEFIKAELNAWLRVEETK